MSEDLARRQDHVVYSISIALVIIALALGIDYLIASTPQGMQMRLLRQVTGGAGSGSEWMVLLVACAAYLVFRLVRPFPFTQPQVEPPAGALYWLGTFIVTLTAAASVSFLAWAVLNPSILASYRTTVLALSIATIAGFVLVEASIVRKSATGTARAIYADAGLLSALIVLPACLAWFVATSPGSGIGRLLLPLFRVDVGRIGGPLALAAGIFVLWGISMPLRRHLRRRLLYRAAVGALWVFGMACYAMQAVIARRTPRSVSAAPDQLEELWAYAYSYPASALIGMAFLWLLVAGALYVALRKWSPA